MNSPVALARIQKAEKELQQLETAYAELATDASLTAASMAPPPFGTAADVVSLGRSLWKGDWGGALLDVVGIIPLVGDGIKGVSKGTQIAAKMKQVDIAIKAAKVRLVRTKMGLSVSDIKKTQASTTDAAKNCAVQRCPKKQGGGVGAKSVPPIKLPVTEVKKFSPYNNKNFKNLSEKDKKSYLKEYSRQLKRQEGAINNMSADEFKAARDAYKDIGRNPLAEKMQGDYRKDFKKNARTNIEKSLNKRNSSFPKDQRLSPAEIKKIAKERSEAISKDLAALHEPDMVAGGWSKAKPSSMGQSDQPFQGD